GRGAGARAVLTTGPLAACHRRCDDPGMARRRPRGSDGGRSAPPEASPHHHEDPALARMAFFSDGVFAIAISLLILAIRIPRPDEPDADRGLLALLAQQWRSYLAY